MTEIAKDASAGLWSLLRRTTALHGPLDAHCGLMSTEERARVFVEGLGVGDDAQIQLN